MRAALAAILLTIATQAGADTIKELFEKRDVSRLEFTLFKIEQSLLHELQSWLTTSSEDKRASIKVFTSHSNDRISIGASIEGYFSSEKPLFYGSEEGFADMVGMEIFSYFAHFGDPADEDVFGSNMLHLDLGEKFSIGNIQRGSWGYLGTDEVKLEILGKQLAEIIDVVVHFRYFGKGKTSARTFVYKIEAPYERGSGFASENRQLTYKFP